jgi:hypothetical protein
MVSLGRACFGFGCALALAVLRFAGRGSAPSYHSDGVVMRVLKSGVKLSYRSSSDEPQRACLRLSVPGGRAAESPLRRRFSRKHSHRKQQRAEGAEGAEGKGKAKAEAKNEGDGDSGENGDYEEEDDGDDDGGDDDDDDRLLDEWSCARGSLAVGARTMQEGGALGGLTRTQVIGPARSCGSCKRTYGSCGSCMVLVLNRWSSSAWTSW